MNHENHTNHSSDKPGCSAAFALAAWRAGRKARCEAPSAAKPKRERRRDSGATPKKNK